MTFEDSFHYIAQTSLKLSIFLSPSPKQPKKSYLTVNFSSSSGPENKQGDWGKVFPLEEEGRNGVGVGQGRGTGKALGSVSASAARNCLQEGR